MNKCHACGRDSDRVQFGLSSGPRVLYVRTHNRIAQYHWCGDFLCEKIIKALVDYSADVVCGETNERR